MTRNFRFQISVNLTIRRGLRVIDNFMHEFVCKGEPVRREIIGHDLRAAFDVVKDLLLQGASLDVRNDHCTNFASSVRRSPDNGLVPVRYFSSLALAMACSLALRDLCILMGFGPTKVTCTNRAAIAAKFFNRARLHCKPDSVKHEPCGFLSDTDGAVNLIRANAILAIRNHPHRQQPFV